jgi:lipid-binding SYLF domain-containing protein
VLRWIEEHRLHPNNDAVQLKEDPMRIKPMLASAAIALGLAAGSAHAQILQNLENAITGNRPSQADIAAARQEVQGAAQSALAALYALQPGARGDIERAAGYAAFSTFGMKLMIAGGTSGKGLVVNRRTGNQTYMKMLQVQGGLGFGVSQNQLIFVFTTEQALSNFINTGWEFGGQANLSAMAGGEGGMFSGAAQVSPGVYLYQITETGLNATLTVAGTKFFLDSDLN